MGTGRGVTRVHEFSIPFHLGYGISDRFSVRAMVPIVRRRVESALEVHPEGAQAGVNPVSTDPDEVNLFLDQFESGLGQIRSQVDQACAEAGEESSQCHEGRAFLNEAEDLFDSMSGAYAEAGAFPLPGSDAGATLLARVESIQEGMASRGAAGFSAPPPLASTFMDGASFESLFISPAFGLERAPLTGTVQEIWALGDIELSAIARLLDLGRTTEAASSPGFRYRSSAGVLVRLGTAPADSLSDLIGIESQRGRSDVELQLYNDFQLGGRLGMRADLKFGIPIAEDVERLLTPPETILDPEGSRRAILWSPAGYRSIEIVPRVLLTPELAFGFRYHLLMRGEEQYLPANGDDPLPGVPPGGMTEARLHRVGGSLIYSTLEAAREGRTQLPLEVRVRYDVAVAGRGGVPRSKGLEIGLKLFLFQPRPR